MLIYQHYGNRRILEENYENSKELVDAFAVQAAKPNAWKDGYGDWCPPWQSGHYQVCFSEGTIVNTAVYYRSTLLLSQMAEILGKTADAETYKHGQNPSCVHLTPSITKLANIAMEAGGR